MSKNDPKKIRKQALSNASKGVSELERRRKNAEQLRTAFVRACDPAKHDDAKLRGLITLAGGEVERPIPFNDGTCQYQVKITAGNYTSLKEGWPVFESRLNRPYEGPSTFKPKI